MKLKILPVLTLALVLCGISFGQDVLVKPEPENVYLVGPGDVIKVKVNGDNEFDFTATIDENGKIEVPFFEQPVMAKCRSEGELRADVTKLVSKYLRNPMVNVQIERNSRPPAIIFGEVRTPQKIDLRRKSTLLELLSISGGVTEDAGGIIQVFRTQPPICSDNTQDNSWLAENGGLDVPSRIYSLSSLRQGREEANPIINPGDVVVVLKAAPVYITGEVRDPKGILIKEGGLSLYQAVAMLGGPNREAKTKDIKIYRLKVNSKDREIISANYDLIKKGTQKDIMLEPYDIVEVDKSKKSIAQTILEIAIGAGKGGIATVTQGLGTRILY
ncbi:MAG: SLBB domain-containing protein [Pyrinomonadaceae bacterium]